MKYFQLFVVLVWNMRTKINHSTLAQEWLGLIPSEFIQIFIKALKLFLKSIDVLSFLYNFEF